MTRPIFSKQTRRRRLLRHFVPLAILAAAAFTAGVLIASGSSGREAADRFVEAWKRQDFAAMHAELTPEAAARYPLEKFTAEYTRAQRTATLAGIDVGQSRGPIDQRGERVVPVEVEVATDSFGRIEGELGVPVDSDGVAWRPDVVFPGLKQGESLQRRTRAPKRAPILARDRSPLAKGPADARVTTGAGGIVTGELGEPPAARAKAMARQGFPAGTQAGTSGLELAFDGHLAGIPGGTLLAVSDGGRRVLAKAPPKRGKPVRTTIDPGLQQAAADALGDNFGGIAVLDARDGEVLALAGIAFSAPQPPGSTFKIVTTTAALSEGITEPSEQFPVTTSASVGGREIANAHDESCGGNLVQSFARSCNSVFAPLGARLGGEKLLDYAKRFGFNSPPPLYSEDALAATQPPSSTIPDPIGSELEVGVSAIGQGKVLATPLEMASIAQTIANDGVRSPTSLVKNADLRSDQGEVKVAGRSVARQVRDMMIEVVRGGTATSAALPDTQVAGKTGTAELGPKSGQSTDPSNPDAQPEQEVDAWFTAFAPAKDPKVVVAVMIVNADGDGGTVAAPIARQVLQAGL